MHHPPLPAPETPLGLTVLLGAGSLSWIFQSLWRFTPSWEIVPPLLLGTAALIKAFNDWKNDDVERENIRAEAAKRLAIAEAAKRLAMVEIAAKVQAP